jgi:hypothetical protein
MMSRIVKSNFSFHCGDQITGFMVDFERCLKRVMYQEKREGEGKE